MGCGGLAGEKGRAMKVTANRGWRRRRGQNGVKRVVGEGAELATIEWLPLRFEIHAECLFRPRARR